MYKFFFEIIKFAFFIFLIYLIYLSTAGQYAMKMTENIQNNPVKFRFLSCIIVYIALGYMLSQTTSYQQAFLYGISIYAVYDFTNYALFEKYDWKFAIIDTLWGGILFTIMHYIKNKVLT